MAIMGVCNSTPDSFSDGGAYVGAHAACARVDAMLSEGADIVDIGGESTRPGASPVPAHEQLERVLDAVRYASQKAIVSVDTTSPIVADACLEAGASAINDVSCARNVELLRVVARHDAAYVLMHSRGTPESMRGLAEYVDVVADVASEWIHARDRAVCHGVPHEAIVFDPGIGFAKTAEQSMRLLRAVGALGELVQAPVLVGASRKSFLSLVDATAAPHERDGGSIAAAIWAHGGGASIVRVHDVRGTAQALRLVSRLSHGLESAALPAASMQQSPSEVSGA